IAADDRFVDLIEEGFDVAIRITKLEYSGMIARKISDFRIHIFATPEFLERYPDLDHPTALFSGIFSTGFTAKNISS
ncbi:LysR family transcriptional regulator, partial [Rhizobium johnstonii]